MSEQGADLLRRGRRSGKSSHEAWADIQDRNTETEWDIESAIAERERQLRSDTQNFGMESAIRYIGDGESEHSPTQ